MKSFLISASKLLTSAHITILICLLFYTSSSFASENPLTKEIRAENITTWTNFERFSTYSTLKEIEKNTSGLNISSIRPLMKGNCVDTQVRNVISHVNKTSQHASRAQQDELLLIKGLIEESCGNLTHAKELYEESLTLRNNPKATLRSAIVALKQNKPEYASQLIDELDWSNKIPQADSLYLRGISLYLQKKYQLAFKKFEKSSSILPLQLEPTLAAYLSLHKVTGNTDDQEIRDRHAQRIPFYLGRLYAVQPENPHIAFSYIKYLLRSGDPVNNPSNLQKGLDLSRQWTKEPFEEKASLLSLQFLIKQGKKREAYDFLEALENKGVATNKHLKFKKLLNHS